MKTFFEIIPLFTVFLGISGAATDRCTQDIFRNLRVLKDHQEVTLKSSQDLSDSNSLSFVRVNVPVLCKNAIHDIPGLFQLEFRSNGMEEVQPGALRNVPNLINLRITSNNLKVIRKGVFNNLGVKRLDLKQNKIDAVEKGAFDDMPELNVLELDFNGIKELDTSWFVGSPKVQRLAIGDNEIETVPEAAFANLADVPVDIWLMNNKISNIHPKAFQNIKRANYIWLQDNRISEIDEKVFAGIQEIERLSLSGNKLKCVSDGFLGNLHAKSVNFDSNPLDCDTCVPKLKNWAKDNGVDCQLMVRKLECTVERVRKVLNETKS